MNTFLENHFWVDALLRVAPLVTATIIALTFYVGYRFQKASKAVC
jgi:hypothetical protein